MKKVIFADRTYVIIEDHQEEGLERKMNGTAKFRLNHLAGSDLIDPREIRRVTNAQAGQDYSPKVNIIDESHRLASTAEISDEQRAKNIAKLTEIKEKFLAKQAKKLEDKRKEREKQAKQEAKRRAILAKQSEDFLKGDKNG